MTSLSTGKRWKPTARISSTNMKYVLPLDANINKDICVYTKKGAYNGSRTTFLQLHILSVPGAPRKKTSTIVPKRLVEWVDNKTWSSP